MDERRPSARYGINKGYFNLDNSDNNGYIAGTASPMERRNYNPYLAWFGLKNMKNIGAESRSALAAGVAGVAVLLYILQDSFITALHILCGLFAPMFSVICAFYWLAIYLRKSWTGNNVYVFFMACYVGEIFGQICFGAWNLFSPWLVASVLASASLVSMTSTLSTPQSALVISFLSFMRFLNGSTLHGLPMWMRPYFAYFCGIVGCVLSKYTEAHLFRHSSIVAQFANDGKIPVLRRRRTSSQSSVASHSHKTRRTSLPALIQRPQVCNSVVDIAVMQEAHGLIMDMLADSTLPPNVVSGLKAVSSLLSPPTNYNTLQRPKISPLVALSESMYTSDIDDSPYVGERPLSLPKRLRRSLPPSLIRRMSTTWTTTTSATGMPTLEPQPLRTRSSSFRHSRDLTSSPSPGNSRSSSPAPLSRQGGGDGSLKSRSFSVGTGGLGQRSPSPNLMPPDGKGLRSSSLRGSLGGSSMPTLLKSENGQSPRLDDSLDAAEDSDDDTSRLEELSNQPITLTITPDDAAKDASENVENAESTAAPTDNNNTNNVEKSDEPSTLGSSLKPRGSSKKRGSVTISEHATIIEEGMARTIPVDETPITEGTEDQDEELAVDESIEEVDPTHEECRVLLGRLDEWDFPIFELSELSENQVLSQVAYRLFTDAGIFETFRISLPEFMNYFRALECGYRHKPYHNRIHAADVLHGCYYMSTQQIPGFTQVNPEDLDPMGRQDDDPDSFHTPTVTPRASISSDSSYGILAGNLPALELMALYTAAAMHDYDHPGRTNAFLVATSASQAILYNDRSVLENHHAAASWSLFLSKPEYNFLSSLDIAEFKRFRFLVVEYILATDLKRHFDFLVEFNSKVNDVDAPGINWAVESDRLLVCQMCIKLADISGPTKYKDLHCNWTYRISEEFYEQGDDERNLGLTVSPYMDRNAPQLAKLQEGFINHLVAPLCNAYGSAGLLPGRWLDEEDDDHAAQSEPKEESEMREFSDKDNDDDDDDDDDNDEESNDGDTKLRLKSAGQQKTRKMVSILTKHLKENHEMWLKVLKEEEAEKRRTENPDGLPPSPTSKDKEDGMSMKSMAPIREDSEERTSDCSRSMEGDNGLADQELSEDGCQDNKIPDEASRVGDVQKAAEET